MEWQTDLLTVPVVATTMLLRAKTSSMVQTSASRSTSCAWTGPGPGLLAKRAGVDEHEPREPEIFHHACGKTHVALVDGGNQHDVNSGHKKLLDCVYRRFQDGCALVVDRVADNNRVGIPAHLCCFLRRVDPAAIVQH